MPDKTPLNPTLFSTDWWAKRNEVDTQIAQQQHRLRMRYPLASDHDTAAQTKLRAESKVATRIALYGDDPLRDPEGLLEERSSGPRDLAARLGQIVLLRFLVRQGGVSKETLAALLVVKNRLVTQARELAEAGEPIEPDQFEDIARRSFLEVLRHD